MRSTTVTGWLIFFWNSFQAAIPPTPNNRMLYENGDVFEFEDGTTLSYES